ncbi:MAG: hypothetical protein EBS83_07815 [Planctomycetia bacterium]|jgi:hypothetical protein|nr:hypothetical protein [Planctomycetia bacterium]
MSSCDLSSGAAKLALAVKHLGIKWDQATDTWNDATAKQFHEEFLVPLTPEVKQMLEAIGRLAEILDRAERDVGDHTTF